jgi:hypothetical protein
MYCCHFSCVVTASSIVVSPLPSNWIVITFFLASWGISNAYAVKLMTYEFDLEQMLVRPNDRLCLHPVCNLLSSTGLFMDSISAQQSTKLLALEITNDGLDLAISDSL